MATLAAGATTEAPSTWDFSCDLEVDFQSDGITRFVYAALAVDKELQRDKMNGRCQSPTGSFLCNL